MQFSDLNIDVIHTKIAGVSFEGRQEIIKILKVGEILELRREPDNKFDRNAIQILREMGEWPATHITQYQQLGYINKELAADLADAMDRGINYICKVSSITGEGKDLLGVNIGITKEEI